MKIRILFACSVAMILVVSTLLARAQASRQLGRIQPETEVTCPSGFDTQCNSSRCSTMKCYSGIVQCQNAAPLGFTYGYEKPTGTASGIIVLLPGSEGTNPNQEQERTFAVDYLNTTGNSAYNQYQVVQLQWDSAWEDTTNGVAGSYPLSIEAAACRPATFLNHIYTKYYLPLQTTNSTAGMCAQGFSAGSGAVGYALAFYGASSYLDKVELLSGPVFSDIKQGCALERNGQNAPDQIVCGGNPAPAWCKLGGNSSWHDSPAYTYSGNGPGGPLASLQAWTDLNSDLDNTCNNNDSMPGGTDTTSQANTNWLNMSIMSTSNPPLLSYPQTVITGFLCDASTSQQINNSSAQGWIFDSAVANTAITNNQPTPTLYAVENCPNAEAVYGPGASVLALSEPGFTAVQNDMSSPTLSQTGACTANH